MLATACACATARAIRVQDALSRRESLEQPILGQLRSSVILVSKTEKTTFQIHHIALSANALFRLTLPRNSSKVIPMRCIRFPRDQMKSIENKNVCLHTSSRPHHRVSRSFTPLLDLQRPVYWKGGRVRDRIRQSIMILLDNEFEC